MSHNADRFYYENFIAAADCSCSAANYLIQCLTDYNPSEIKAMLETMHRFEHTADEKKHEMSAALAKAFVTPFDREDLAELSQNIDEVVDKVEEILQRFYIDDIQTVTPECLRFARKIADCCAQMKEMLTELQNFKKPAKLHSLIISLGNAEEECDRIYLEATMKARKISSDVLEIIAWREIYDCMESCADACEHVADSVETIVMKNT